MEGSRTYTFSLILALCFLLGAGIGMLITQRMHQKSIKELSLLTQTYNTNAIMGKRMRAINQALKEGKTEYEFETSFVPPLSGKK